MTYEQCMQAIRARRDGVFDDPVLMAFGPLMGDDEADVTEMKRRYLVETCGFKIGARDSRLNTDFPGSFMVVEWHEEWELPTRDGSNGPWCIVGDDLSQLIADAFDHAPGTGGDEPA